MSTPSMQEISQEISDVISKLEATPIVDVAVRASYLDKLQEYECWQPLFRFLDASDRSNNKDLRLTDLVRTAKIQNLYLEDPEASAQTVLRIIKDLNLNFSELCIKVLPHIMDSEDFFVEASVLKHLINKFPDKESNIQSLERLCFLFEKKTYNDDLLHPNYQKLLDIDPYNLKALRYFKLLYTQNGQWYDLLNVLRSLMECDSHPHQVFRYAHELAAVLLYHLNRADEAVEVLERFCLESPLDTSSIHFDACYACGDFQGCLRVLKRSIAKLPEEDTGVLYMKMGDIYDRINDSVQAKKAYQKAVQLEPKLVEVSERLLKISIQNKEWDEVLVLLDGLHQKLKSKDLKEQVMMARKRLEEGVASKKQ